LHPGVALVAIGGLIALLAFALHHWRRLTQEVTRCRLAEAELERVMNHTKRASETKSAFLANMSHEIRTPMNAIMGLTELTLGTELDSEQREYLDMVMQSADALLSLINDILDFSKIEAGKLELDHVPFSLRDVVANTMRTLDAGGNQKGLRLAHEIPDEVPDGLVGDPGRLRQILVNLVGNGVKFTEKGSITVRVALESSADGWGTLHFEVSDTGIGIAPEKRQAIFEAYAQADGLTATGASGTGLGLAISSQLVTMMGGRMWVDSEIGKGSTFHFDLRVGLQEAALAGVSPADPSALVGRSVLIVDSNNANRAHLVRAFKQWRSSPTAVDNGSVAYIHLKQAALAGQPFHLILLRAASSDLDGFALAERIKSTPELDTIPILLVSSAGQRGDAIRCRELGITAYLTTPIPEADLLEVALTALAENGSAGDRALITRHSLRERRRTRAQLSAQPDCA